MAALRSEAVLDRTVDVSREEEPRRGRAASTADGVVIVDALGAVLWCSAGVEVALQRVGRRWLPGMAIREALGCSARSVEADGDEPEIWRSGEGGATLKMAIRRRPIRSGPDGLTALEVRFLTPLAGSEASARDVRVSALGRLSVTVGDSSRDGDWLQQRPGQVFRYLLACRSGAQRSEAIASALWPERGPSAVANVRYCIFKLREQLAEPGAPSQSLVVRDAAGYRIDVRRVELDVDVFQAKYSAGIAAQRRGESAEAEVLLGDAVAALPRRVPRRRPVRRLGVQRARVPAVARRQGARSTGADLARQRAPGRGGRAPAAARRARAVRLARASDADRGLLTAGPPHRSAPPLPRPPREAAPSVRRAAGLRADLRGGRACRHPGPRPRAQRLDSPALDTALTEFEGVQANFWTLAG